MTSKRVTFAVATLVVCGVIALLTLPGARAQAQPRAPQTATQAPAPATPQSPDSAPLPTDTDHGTALMLLDRVATLLDEAVRSKSGKSDAVGTSGSNENLGRVVIDRATLDEIRAEIAQVKLLLHDAKPTSSALRPRGTNGEAR